MDILNRIRDILGVNKTQKRKHSDFGDLDLNSSELKRRRSLFSNHAMTPSKHYGIDTTATNHSNRNITHDYDDETYQSITTFIEGNNPQDFKAPMTNGKRKVPDLINVRTTINDSIYNSIKNGPQQTIKPHFDRFGRGERNQFRNVPPLYCVKPILPDRTNQNSNFFNNSQKTFPSSSILANNSYISHNSRHKMQQSKSTLSNGYENGEESIFSQKPLSSTANFRKNDRFSGSQLAPQTDIGRAEYQSLLSKIVPGYSYFAKTFKGTKIETNNILDTILDDDRQSNASTSLKNRSSIIDPVNSLKARFEVLPILKQNWEAELNEKYSTLNLSRKDTKQAEEEASKSAEIKSQHYEKTVLENNRKASIASWQSYEIGEEEANDYPPFDEEKHKQIIRFVSGRDTATVLIEKFNLSITRSDIQTLNWNPLTWLNDEVINFYMELLGERSRQNENLPKVHAMNTFFLPRLLENGYSGVRRWTRKVDIFSFDVIPVPVHKGIHWCMAIIHLKNKTIKYYDSMGAPNNQALNALTEYLKSESLDKKKVEFDLNGWTMENVRNIPQQENGSDCGVFSCMYAEFVTRNRPIIFTQQHMQYFRMKMIFEICTGRMLN